MEQEDKWALQTRVYFFQTWYVMTFQDKNKVDGPHTMSPRKCRCGWCKLGHFIILLLIVTIGPWFSMYILIIVDSVWVIQFWRNISFCYETLWNFNWFSQLSHLLSLGIFFYCLVHKDIQAIYSVNFFLHNLPRSTLAYRTWDMVPTLFQIQNSRTFQGPFKDFSIFFKDVFLCMLKKWFDDHTNKFRPKGMKNGNFGVFITFFNQISDIVYRYLCFGFILIK